MHEDEDVSIQSHINGAKYAKCAAEFIESFKSLNHKDFATQKLTEDVIKKLKNDPAFSKLINEFTQWNQCEIPESMEVLDLSLSQAMR